jgi:hypothetical protein
MDQYGAPPVFNDTQGFNDLLLCNVSGSHFYSVQKQTFIRQVVLVAVKFSQIQHFSNTE